MTGNEFNAEYKLGQRIASSGVESYLAHVTATRRLVMVHKLGGTNEGERRRIASLLGALPTRSTTVIARLDVDGEAVIVTEFLPDFVNLRDWLEAAVAVQTTVVIRTGLPTPPPAAAAEPPAVEARPASEAGDFTRVFGQPLGASPPPPSHPAPPIGAPPGKPSTPAPGPATGSFTAVFGAAPEPAAPPLAHRTPVAPPQPPPAAPVQPPAAPAPSQPASFTALFGAPVQPAGPPPAHAPPSPPLQAPPQPASGGEFTRMFGAAATPASAPLSPDPIASAPRAEPPRPAPPRPAPPPHTAPPEAHPPYAAPPLAHPPAGGAASGASDAPKIRVMWRPREGMPGSTSAGNPPASATGAMAPTPRSPELEPPMFAPPAAPMSPPFAAPPGPQYAPPSPAPAYPSVPPSATPGAASLFGAPSLTPRGAGPGSNAPSPGPPELRLYANEAGERVEPYAPPPVPSSAPAPRSSGPSDFTRMLTPVEAPPSSPAAPAVKPSAKAEPAGGGRRPSALPLILVVTFALIAAAVLVVLVVVLRK